MELTMLIKLVSVVLAISLASERLVTLLKTLFPALAGDATTPANVTDKWRQVLIMVIAFLCAWLTASFLNDGKFHPEQSYDIGPPKTPIPFWIIGLLASGGSAFWTNLLGYLQAVKNATNQKFLQQKLRYEREVAQGTK